MNEHVLEWNFEGDLHEQLDFFSGASESYPEFDALLHRKVRAASLFTSESVPEGHPDKGCDSIVDSLLDAYPSEDQERRVACKVLCKNDVVGLAGEITSRGTLDHAAAVLFNLNGVEYLKERMETS